MSFSSSERPTPHSSEGESLKTSKVGNKHSPLQNLKRHQLLQSKVELSEEIVDANSEDVESNYNPDPQAAPGASAAAGHSSDNSIPLSIFPITLDRYFVCFCGLPGRGKTQISRRLGRYLSFFHATPVQVFHDGDYEFNVRTNSKTNGGELQKVYDSVLGEIVRFLNDNSSAVAILDSTSCCHSRRMDLLNAVR
jgi:hypothetical protein